MNTGGGKTVVGLLMLKSCLNEGVGPAVYVTPDNYLVSNGHLDAAKVSAQGKGETSPVTKTEDCKGNTANAKLIACLQPDRRVEIAVSGTR